MTIQPLDILEVVARGEFEGVEDTINVYQFRHIGVAAIPDAEGVLSINDHMDDTYQLLLASQSTTYVYRDITIKNITQAVNLGTFPWPTLLSGSAAQANIPPGIAGLINMGTNVARVVLRKYIGGWVANVLDPDGTLTAGVVAGLLAFGARLLSTSANTGGRFEYGYFSPKTLSWETPVSATVSDISAYQRRRKQGRGV